MGIQRFSIGKQFNWAGSNYVVKRLLENLQLCVEKTATGETQVTSLTHLVEALAAGTLVFESVGNAPPNTKPPVLEAQLADYPAPAVAIAQYRLGVIRPLLNLPPAQLTKTAVRARVAEMRQAAPLAPDAKPRLNTALSVRSVYRWLAAYRENGEDVRALLPHTQRRGGKGVSRLSAEVLAVIDTVLQENYLKREHISHKALRYLIAARLAEENQARPASEPLPMPSQATVTRRIAALDLQTRHAAKHGVRATRRAFRQVGQMDYPTRPLERCEIDHTTVDVIVIDEQDHLPLGRPTLTYCLDEAMLATTKHPWLAYGVPVKLVVDGAPEFRGHDLAEACLQLGIELVPSPVHTPEFKAGVERHIRTFNTGLFHTLPGTTFSNVLDRGDYASATHACISLRELSELFTQYIVDTYTQEFHEGLQDIPAQRWAAALSQEVFNPRLVDKPKELRIILGRFAWRKLQHYGVEFLGLRYNCEALGPIRATLAQTAQRSVKFKYDPSNLSEIYVFQPHAQLPQYLPVPALDLEYTAGLSLWKHRAIRALARQQAPRVDMVALGQARRQLQEIVKTAQARQQAATRVSRKRWLGTHPAPDLQNDLAPGPAVLQPTVETAVPQQVSNPNVRPEAEWEVTKTRLA